MTPRMNVYTFLTSTCCHISTHLVQYSVRAEPSPHWPSSCSAVTH